MRLAILLLCACTVAIENPEDLAREIRNAGLVREEWEVDWNDKRLDHIMTLYADDAVFLRPTSERTTGRTAIRILFEKVSAKNTAHITMHSITVERSGNLAYDSGTYEETTVSGGVARATRGDYLIILKREDGHWRIVQQAWTDLGPPDRRAAVPAAVIGRLARSPFENSPSETLGECGRDARSPSTSENG